MIVSTRRLAAHFTLICACLGILVSASSALHPVQDEDSVIRFGDDPEHRWSLPLVTIAGRVPDYDPALPAPEALLGQPVGERMAHHAEIIAAFKRWGELSPRVVVETYARTHEGRELVRAIITSEANHARLDAIRGQIHELWDPRELGEQRAAFLVRTTPAIAWMGYSIHGDETSGSDASLAVGYHLAAARDEEVLALLEGLVVVIDPVMNPDGRERIVSLVEQSSGYVSNLDVRSMQRGHWPYGRGNHYLFDMNRDWMAGVAPETRGRWRVLADLPPQLFVDAHEMSGYDTFLFYPQTEPQNPVLPASLFTWQGRFADRIAAAFDHFGWGYYTREWADAWYPAYSDAWGSLNGAIGMLYEQGRTSGMPLRRESGEVVPYRRAVHGQVAASMASLQTLFDHREAIMADYLAARRTPLKGLRDAASQQARTYVIPPGQASDRVERLLSMLLPQGIEVMESLAEWDCGAGIDGLGRSHEAQKLPKGCLIIQDNQPQGRLVRAYLDFDPRMDAEFLLKERKSLERGGSSKIYDVTAWDLSRALGLNQARWVQVSGTDAALLRPVKSAADWATLAASQALQQRGKVNDTRPVYAWIVDGGPDASVRFAARAMGLGLAVHQADEAFDDERGFEYPRGSLLMRRHENPENLAELVARAASEAGVLAHAVYSGRAPGTGADLGGGHFHLLTRPRVALLANAPVSQTDFGAIWHLLDAELRIPLTLIDAQSFGRADLRNYNVLILPSGGGDVVGDHGAALKTWVRAGGTLIAVGSAARALCSDSAGLSAVRTRRQVLDDLKGYEFAARREGAGLEVSIDEAGLWGDAEEQEADESLPVAAAQGDAATAGGEPVPTDMDATEQDAEEEGEPESQETLEDPDPKRQDAWMRRFSPAGVSLLARTDLKHWITNGCTAEMAVPYQGSTVFLSRGPVRTPVRLAAAAELRLAGLLWPEARARLASAAWLTTERVGRGQLVLFSSAPAFRGYYHATARMLSNAVVFGPGRGAAPLRRR